MIITSLARPSYHQGFATRGLSKRPNLWKGLIGCWKPSLGITGVATLRDVSGFENHGTMQGSMTIDDWVIGGNPRMPGYVLDFDSGDDHIDIGDLEGFDFIDEIFSIAAWVYKTGDVGIEYIVSKGANFGGWGVYLDGVDPADINFVLGSNTIAKAVGALVVDEWHHLACTADGAGNSGKVYIDGVEKVSDVIDFENTANASVLSIGSDSGVLFFYGGVLDDIHIYNRVLSPVEVLDKFQHPNAMFQFRDMVIGKAPAVVVTVPDETLAPTMQLVNSGGMIGAVNV